MIHLDILVITVLAFTAFVLWLRARHTAPKSLVGRTVIATTADDRSLKGSVVEDDAGRLTLASAVVLSATAEIPVEGLVHLPAASLSFVQEVGSASEED